MQPDSGLIAALRQEGMNTWAEALPRQYQRLLSASTHGDENRWREALRRLPVLAAKRVDFSSDAVTVDGAPLTPRQLGSLEALLMELHPWRKGPFLLHGLHVDAEWRSDLKWRRIQQAASPLAGRAILDVGCGNGYYGWRMLGEGARLVVGIDPTRLFWMQYRAVRHFAGEEWPHFMLPMAVEDLPPQLQAFDTVFSMGVLYHRRSPIDHLLELKSALKPGGELVLETLVIGGGEGEVLVPHGRYAKMRNLWFMPSPPTLLAWLRRVGFSDARVADVAATTVEEQRATAWMRFESLPDFLDPDDPARTVEGYPAPVRAVIVATKR